MTAALASGQGVPKSCFRVPSAGPPGPVSPGENKFIQTLRGLLIYPITCRDSSHKPKARITVEIEFPSSDCQPERTSGTRLEGAGRVGPGPLNEPNDFSDQAKSEARAAERDKKSGPSLAATCLSHVASHSVNDTVTRLVAGPGVQVRLGETRRLRGADADSPAEPESSVTDHHASH